MISVHRQDCSITCLSTRGMKLVNWLFSTIIVFYQGLSSTGFFCKGFQTIPSEANYLCFLIEIGVNDKSPWTQNVACLAYGCTLVVSVCSCGDQTGPSRWRHELECVVSLLFIHLPCSSIKSKLIKTNVSQSEPQSFCHSARLALVFIFPGWLFSF